MYRTQNQTALDSVGALDLSDDDRAVLRDILERNLAFMDECLSTGRYTYEGLETYIRGCTPISVKTIGIGSSLQVGHWMQVVEEWKTRLGEGWDRTYAVTNSLYVARQNNILFSVLAQFMGLETMGDRLLLVETPEFETSPEKLLDVLGRIVADRGLGMVFFKNYFLMDVEPLAPSSSRAATPPTGPAAPPRTPSRCPPTTTLGQRWRRAGRATPSVSPRRRVRRSSRSSMPRNLRCASSSVDRRSSWCTTPTSSVWRTGRSGRASPRQPKAAESGARDTTANEAR